MDYCYSLSNESSRQKTPGFYIQNVNAFIEKKIESTNFKLKSAMVGENALLDYYKDDMRLAYMSNYENVKIVPVLHRTVIAFIGMRHRTHYVAFRKVRDKLLALDRKSHVTVWSIVTGKIESMGSLKMHFDLNDYEIYANNENDITYKSEWYQPKVLLIDKTHPETVDEQKFYGERFQTDLGNNASYVKTQNKTFYRFKMIELTESGDVVQHFTFVHPYFGDDKFQRLFFSDDLKHMLER